MKKLILIVLACFILTGCEFTLPSGDIVTSGVIYDLNDFEVPNDSEFIAIIEDLTTPTKIVDYMADNFEHVISLWYCYSPYQMWVANIKAGDCNDMSNFAVWVASYHGYTTYQVWVFYKGERVSHMLGVFVEDGKMNYSSNTSYHKLQTLSFRDIAEDNCIRFGKELKGYRVLDFNENLIEKGEVK